MVSISLLPRLGTRTVLVLATKTVERKGGEGGGRKRRRKRGRKEEREKGRERRERKILSGHPRAVKYSGIISAEKRASIRHLEKAELFLQCSMC